MSKLDFGRDAEAFLREISEKKGEEMPTLSDYGDGESRVEILSIKTCALDKCLVSLCVSNKFSKENIELVLLKELCERLILTCGEIDEETLKKIESYSTVTRAYSSACSSFAYVDSSVAMLERKLLRKGFSKEVSRDAANIVAEKGFVDENEIACHRAQLCVEKKWGRARILTKLRQEGYRDEAIKNAAEYLSGVDFSENCKALIERKFGGVPLEKSERDKMFSSLSRMGYSSSDIRRAINKVK